MPIYQITLPDGISNRILADAAFIAANFPGAVLMPEPELASDASAAPQPPRIITRLALRNRFTAAEKVALELAALDSPDAPLEQRQQAAMLRVYLKDLDSATFVDLELADTRAGVQMLESAGLLAAGRAAEILDAPVTDGEAWRA